jgi:uncharacterized membrane protein SirB2
LSARRPAGFAPVNILLLAAFLEVAINRVAVPLLRPAKGVPPTWHTVLDFSGLFLFYFTGTLAAILVGARVVGAMRGRVIEIVAGVALAAARRAASDSRSARTR